MRSTMRSPSSGCWRMIAHSSSSSAVGLSRTRSGTESLPMSCSQPPSSQRSAVRESSCSARAMRAARAGDAIVGSHSGAQAASDLHEHAIAGAMPEGVVDLLEVVEVEQHEAAGMPGLERQRDMLAEREPVMRSRDDIRARLLFGLHSQLAKLDVGAAQLVDARLQAALKLTAIADVEHQAQADVAAVAGVVRDVAIEHPALDAVVAHEAVRGLELGPVRGALVLQVVEIAHVVGVDQVGPLTARRGSVGRESAREALAVGA